MGEKINMYNICTQFVKPLTARYQCSWVELVATGAQLPVWFISHAWATPFAQTLEMLLWHMTVHQLSIDSAYWFCTLANNQWELGELGGSLEDTPFWRAIGLCTCLGVVQVMDAMCTPHKRVWCIMELYVALEMPGKLFEVLTMIPKDTQLQGDKDVPAGPALLDAEQNEHIKSALEGKGGFFPPEIAVKGARVKVQNAQASQPQDRRSILQRIVQSDDSSSEPPVEHPRYDVVNRKVQGLFRGAALYSHAIRGEVAELRELLSESTEGLDYRSADGVSSVWMAAQKGHTEVVKVLAGFGADVKQADNNGHSPVWKAAQKGHTEVIKVLAGLGADVNQADNNGRSPVWEAADQGHTEVVKVLAGLGADVNQAENEGVAPLEQAAYKGHEEAVRMLLGVGADANPAPDIRGDTPLSDAKAGGHTKIVELLVEAGARVD